MKAVWIALATVLCATAADVGPAKLYDAQLTAMEQEFMPLVKEFPEASFGFAPKNGAFQNARTFAAQAKHVATVMYLVAAASLKEKPPVDLGSGEEGPASVKSKADIVKYLTDAFAYAHKAMNALTEKNQYELVKAPFPGMPDTPRAAIANIAIFHSFDHYGQMAVYARMNNFIPPASR